MPIRYRIQRNLQIVHTMIGGEAGLSDLRAYSEQLKNDSDFDSSFDHVIEFSKEDHAVHSHVLSHLVPPFARVQMAIVTPSEPGYEVAQQFQSIYGLPTEIFSVFRDLKHAMEWLGLDDSQAEWGDWKSIVVAEG